MVAVSFASSTTRSWMGVEETSSGRNLMTMTLITMLDPTLLRGVAVAAMFSVVVSLFSVMRKPACLCLATVLAAALLLGRAFPGFIVVTGIVYVCISSLSRQAVAS